MDVENLDHFKYPFSGAKNGPFFDLAGVVLPSSRCDGGASSSCLRSAGVKEGNARVASVLTNMLGHVCARTGTLKTQRRTPFWGPNLDPKTGGPNTFLLMTARSDVFRAARFPKTVAESKSVGFIGMLGCACDPFVCASHWWMRPGSAFCELGRPSAAKPKKNPFLNPKRVPNHQQKTGCASADVATPLGSLQRTRGHHCGVPKHWQGAFFFDSGALIGV